MAESHLEVQLIKKDIEKVESNLNSLRSDRKEVHSRVTTVSLELEEKIQSLHDEGIHHISLLRDDIKDERTVVHTRLRALEQWKYTVVGVSLASGFVLALILGKSDVLTGFFK